MQKLRKIHVTHRVMVALVMFLFSMSITFGPNLQPLTGVLSWVLATFGVHPDALAVATAVGAGAIIWLRPKKWAFILATSPLAAFYVAVIVYTITHGFNIGSGVFSLMSYLYILRAAND